MANEQHLAWLDRGVIAWNVWREEHPDIAPDLFRADLRWVGLRGEDLRWADLSKADLRWGDLRGADLRGADLRKADLSKADLSHVRLFGADLSHAHLVGADLSKANLRETNLSGASLTNAHLVGAILSNADVIGADLNGADLRQAMLIDSRLDGANLTGARLWETQRSGWSIKGVICQHAFWDRDGKEPTEYGEGDFERIFAEKPRIVLRYPGGPSLVELAMLPLIIERLQAEHPDCVLHIRSVQDDGSGATVTITVDDLANRDSGIFRHEVERLQAELKYVEGQRDLFRDQFMPIFCELVIRGRQMIIGQFTSLTMIEDSMSRDTYNIPGQIVGAVGPHSHADNMTFQQIQNNLDLPKLAEELGRLRAAMKRETEGTREQDKAIAAVAEAEEVAIRGDGQTALQHLKTAGKWTLGIAEKIGVPLAVEALKRMIGPT